MISPEKLDILRGFIDGLKPIPLLTVSEWADKYRMLSSVASSEPGPYRTSRTPYLKDIMDDLSAHSPVETVVFIKAAQIGATEAGNNWCGYVASISPAPMLMVMPTDETVKRNSKIRIDPMIEATPILRDRIAPARSRDSNNTINTKNFPGGVLVMTGANSAVGLRSMPVRFLFLDECDAYPRDLEGEGSPIELAKARTRTFSRRKIFMPSTPTIEGASIIESEFQQTDRRRYFVPCVHCGAMQYLKWDNIIWEPGKPETAKYKCDHCEELIEERHKTEMLEAGEWRATMPEHESPKKKGYHVNSLYSPLGWYSWADAVREFEDAEKDPLKMKTFVNTVLGETWKESGDAPPWENLYNRRETYAMNKPNKDVVFLTAGLDVQKDRLEVEVVGYCRDKRTYSVDYRVFPGDTADPKTWDPAAAMLREIWLREDGARLPLRLMAVDTGYNTEHAYKFCKRFDATRVVPVKGNAKQHVLIAAPRAVDINLSGKKIGRVKVWQIGVNMFKSELYGQLKLEKDENGTPPPGFCHFPQYNHEYFRGITAEQLQIKADKKGYDVYEWVKKYPRNEPLDCRVYARAAASIIGLDRFREEHWNEMEITNAPAPNLEKQKPKRRSNFW